MSMRVLADENFPREAVLALRARGHDVVWMHEAAPGLGDADVLHRAHAEGRVLLTNVAQPPALMGTGEASLIPYPLSLL